MKKLIGTNHIVKGITINNPYVIGITSMINEAQGTTI
jgi:hypothetical protein